MAERVPSGVSLRLSTMCREKKCTLKLGPQTPLPPSSKKSRRRTSGPILVDIAILVEVCFCMLGSGFLVVGAVGYRHVLSMPTLCMC